jgi:hypothetical protein
MSALGEQATFTLCVASSSAATTHLQFIFQNGGDNNYTGNYSGLTALSAISACPTMQAISIAVAGGTLDATRVASLGIVVQADNIASTGAPTVINVDSIKLTDNAAGPYDFTFNSLPMSINQYVPLVPNSAISFAGSGGGTTAGTAGVAVLSVPFTATGATQQFNYTLGGDVNFSAFSSATVSYRVCVNSATTTPANYQFSQYITNNNGNGHYSGSASLSTLTTCPTMQAVDFPLNGGNLDLTKVNNIGLSIASTGAGPFGTAVVEVDSITVTPGNSAGPYDFAYNTDSFQPGTYNPISGSTVTWRATP